ncbi:ABC transporter substrate-binding protein [Hoyosella sp. YIM 151337]|uniref:ABC transporter substrate-binding protein n=1 Tax=Hoyosella sp. YIM 151337 TaxID=2992742 RepID=UPI0022364207|nr:ABC transporter substrate-binding protein [Hoyosella sp. YIM 151337]MCW4352987.1 ABC transporter substrate-binding protein [Hoyosella sp. YIM 151337]
MKRIGRLAAVLAATAVVVSACGGEPDDPLANGGQAGEIVVGSANFPENVLLAEIYAQALEAEGATVRRQYNIGSREIYYGQIERGAISVLPEYNGALLAYLDDGSDARTTDAINEALAAALPEGLTILDSAPAENKDSLVVTQQTADEFDLQSIEDLAPVAGEMRVGAAPEFRDRQQGLLGLEEYYGVVFDEFVPTDNSGPLTISALERGDIDVANIYSTDPSLTTRPFVALDDPEAVFGSQNVTPLAGSGALDEQSIAVLNDVSARLTTEVLTELLSQVVTERRDVDDVAREWLETGSR